MARCSTRSTTRFPCAPCRLPMRATSSSTSRATRCGPTTAGRDWGLEYLFGVVDHDGRRGELPPVLGARPRARRRPALLGFLDYVTERRRRAPRACTSTTTPATSAPTSSSSDARHGVGEAPARRPARRETCSSTCTRSSSAASASPRRSYSLKKLEPLYMGDRLRESEVKDARSLDRAVRRIHARP